MKAKLTVTITATLITALFASIATAQKSGQSISIVHGTVTGAKNVTESSNAGKGAVLGGVIGYQTSSSSHSSSRKRKNAAIGATAGGALANRAQGDRSAKEYTVETASGITVIISDQTEIVLGDCVIVENAGSNNANIRRVSETYCEPEAQEVVAEMADEMMEEAQECAAAKTELSAAQDDAAFNRAVMKVEMLCDT